MTKRTLAIVVSSIIETLDEASPGREGPMYATMMGMISLDEFQGIIAALAKDGCVTRGAGFLVTITDKGRALAKDIKALRGAKVAS